MLSDYLRLMQAPVGACPDDALPQSPTVERQHASESQLVTAFQLAQTSLMHDLIGFIHAQTPAFFEDLIIDVLLAMGYGARRRDLACRLGRSGDGGVDGLISQDELGLDQIYLQAKRLKPGAVVPVSDVRDFVGSLDAHHANKGIFVTTGCFSGPAVDVCTQVSRQVSLIDGPKLARLMIRYNIGVAVIETYQIKRVDPGYFRGFAPSRASPIAASYKQRRFEAER